MINLMMMVVMMMMMLFFPRAEPGEAPHGEGGGGHHPY